MNKGKFIMTCGITSVWIYHIDPLCMFLEMSLNQFKQRAFMTRWVMKDTQAPRIL